MHDIVDLERRGLPGVFVATVQFIDGAQAQSAALGASPASVFVEHPIQDRTDAEMLAIAEQAVDEIVRQIVSQPT